MDNVSRQNAIATSSYQLIQFTRCDEYLSKSNILNLHDLPLRIIKISNLVIQTILGQRKSFL
jgi:hypothetical protein